MDTHKIIKNVKDYGYFKIENFLNEKEVEQIKKMAKNIHKGDGSKQYIPHTYPMLLKKIIKFDFKKLKQGLILKDIVKKRPELKSICDGVFEEKNNLKFIDTYSLKNSQKVPPSKTVARLPVGGHYYLGLRIITRIIILIILE